MIGAEQVKLIAFDVDGTLTDGTLVIGSGGEAYKLFNAHDGLAISLAHRMGYAVGFITGRTSTIVEARAKELSCDFVLMGIRHKVSALQQLLMERALCWDEAAYMGDDLNDLSLFSRVGLSGCPADACEENQSAADFISRYGGGRGAAREFRMYFEISGALGGGGVLLSGRRSERLEAVTIGRFPMKWFTDRFPSSGERVRIKGAGYHSPSWSDLRSFHYYSLVLGKKNQPCYSMYDMDS